MFGDCIWFLRLHILIYYIFKATVLKFSLTNSITQTFFNSDLERMYLIKNSKIKKIYT